MFLEFLHSQVTLLSPALSPEGAEQLLPVRAHISNARQVRQQTNDSAPRSSHSCTQGYGMGMHGAFEWRGAWSILTAARRSSIAATKGYVIHIHTMYMGPLYLWSRGIPRGSNSRHSLGSSKAQDCASVSHTDFFTPRITYEDAFPPQRPQGCTICRAAERAQPTFHSRTTEATAMLMSGLLASGSARALQRKCKQSMAALQQHYTDSRRPPFPCCSGFATQTLT